MSALNEHSFGDILCVEIALFWSATSGWWLNFLNNLLPLAVLIIMSNTKPEKKHEDIVSRCIISHCKIN